MPKEAAKPDGLVHADRTTFQVGAGDLGPGDLFPENERYPSVVPSGLTLYEVKKPPDPRTPEAAAFNPVEIYDITPEAYQALVDDGFTLISVGGERVTRESKKEEKNLPKKKEQKKPVATQSTLW